MLKGTEIGGDVIRTHHFALENKQAAMGGGVFRRKWAGMARMVEI